MASRETRFELFEGFIPAGGISRTAWLWVVDPIAMHRSLKNLLFFVRDNISHQWDDDENYEISIRSDDPQNLSGIRESSIRGVRRAIEILRLVLSDKPNLPIDVRRFRELLESLEAEDCNAEQVWRCTRRTLDELSLLTEWIAFRRHIERKTEPEELRKPAPPLEKRRRLLAAYVQARSMLVAAGEKVTDEKTKEVMRKELNLTFRTDDHRTAKEDYRRMIRSGLSLEHFDPNNP
ncbi:MAG: hypothetical protein ACK526_19260 [Planctomyces sp.]|jgi:hypothetical protein